MKWITPFPLNWHDSWACFTLATRTKPAQSWIKHAPRVNLVVNTTEQEEAVTLVVICFTEDGLIHSALTPSRLVNINVSALDSWLHFFSHHLIQKKPFATQYVNWKDRSGLVPAAQRNCLAIVISFSTEKTAATKLRTFMKIVLWRRAGAMKIFVLKYL